jgi:hypothetical protein
MSSCFIEGLLVGTEMKQIDILMSRLRSIPAQYKYIAAVDVNRVELDRPFGLSHDIAEMSFAPDGLGRVGFLVVEPAADLLSVRVALPAERFRAYIAKLAEEYIQHHSPDWEMRA